MIEVYRNVLKEPKFILIAAYSFLMCFEYIFVEALGGDSIFKPYRIAGILLIAYAFLNACLKIIEKLLAPFALAVLI